MIIRTTESLLEAPCVTVLAWIPASALRTRHSAPPRLERKLIAGGLRELLIHQLTGLARRSPSGDARSAGRRRHSGRLGPGSRCRRRSGHLRAAGGWAAGGGRS